MSHTAGAYRRPLTLLAVAALGWGLLAGVRAMMPAGNGLASRYYSNTSFAGWPVESGYDPVPSLARIAERWHGRPPQAFGIVWTGYITVPRADLYRFVTTSDDGSRLFVDDRLVVDNAGPHSSATQSGTISLSGGSHRVRLEYTEFGGGSELAWSWARGDRASVPVPAWALSRRPVGAATVTAVRVAGLGETVLALLVVAMGTWSVAVALPRVAAATIARRPIAAYGGARSLVFSLAILVGLFLMPWPGGQGAPFFRSIELTVANMARALAGVLHDPRSFQSNLSVPMAGEENAGPAAYQAAAMLRAGSVDRYELSSGLARDDWAYEQIVATSWPRKREKDAHVRVVLNTEPTPGCELVNKGKDVSLVYCP